MKRLLPVTAVVLVLTGSSTAQAQVWGWGWGGWPGFGMPVAPVWEPPWMVPGPCFVPPCFVAPPIEVFDPVGLAELTRAQGEAAQAGSEALLRMEDVRSRQIENQLRELEARLERQRIARAAREEKYAVRREARDRYLARQEPAAPQPLGPDQLNPETGKIRWPAALLDRRYDDYRERLEDLHFTLALDDAGDLTRDISRTARQMQEELKADIHNLTAHEYLTARKFLQSLAWIDAAQ